MGKSGMRKCAGLGRGEVWVTSQLVLLFNAACWNWRFQNRDDAKPAEGLLIHTQVDGGIAAYMRKQI